MIMNSARKPPLSHTRTHKKLIHRDSLKDTHTQTDDGCIKESDTKVNKQHSFKLSAAD